MKRLPNYMRTIIATTFGVILAAPPALGADLASYRWKNRLLLVFSPTESYSGYAVFNRSLGDAVPGINDRDLILFRVFEAGQSLLMEKALSPEDADQLRRRFGAKADRLTVILVGKDGGVKMVREHRVELREIFELIDSMPMRQQEMKERGSTR